MPQPIRGRWDLSTLDTRSRSLGCREEQQDRDSAPHEPVSFLHRQAWASDVLFAVELWGPSGSSWKSKGKEQHLGLAEVGCGVLAGWDTGEFQGLREEEWEALEEGTGQGSSTRLLVPKFSLNSAVLPGCSSVPHGLLKIGGGRTGLFPLSFLLRLSSSPLLDPLGGEWELLD